MTREQTTQQVRRFFVTHKKLILWTAPLSLPLLLLIGLLFHFTVNVPFWDQWELVPLLQKWGTHTLGFADFFAQHNEHRIFFPRIVMFTLAKLTHWNTLFEVTFSLLVAITAFVFLYKILAQTIAHRWVRLGTALLVSAIFFSPLGWENWLWGWQMQWFLDIAGLIIAVWALGVWQTASPYKRMTVGALAAIIATYSLASGFFVWIVCLPLVFFDKKLRPLLLTWMALGAAAIAAYYVGYHDPGGQPAKSLFLHQPHLFIHYFLVYIGRPIIPDFLVSVPIALLLLGVAALALVHVWRRYRSQLTGSLLPWLCLATYALMSAFSTSVSRLGYGVEQAYSSRYTTLSNFFIIGMLVVVAKLIELSLGGRKEQRVGVRGAYLVAVSLAAILVLVNCGKGYEQMKLQSIHLHKVQHCLQTVRTEQDPCLLLAYPNQQIAWDRLQYLRRLHYSGL
ncbi:MAG TPA: hypothetical protein VKQ34_03445 [Candidatus Saccharimonadales bacterium]|nr:hypothetical protein [Candidatus Saccharimonadales bacterium]